MCEMSAPYKSKYSPVPDHVKESTVVKGHVTALEGHTDATLTYEVGPINIAVVSGMVSLSDYAKISLCPVKMTARTPDGDVVG